MKIIGYSGLHGSLQFRKANYTQMTEQEYRMCQGLDSAACILIDGKIIAAAEEERFNGEKYTCNFPINAINYCLQEADLAIHDVDFICHGFDYKKYEKIFSITDSSRLYYEEVLSPDAQLRLWKQYFPDFPIHDRFIATDHHLAHAASAYYPSGFDSALILVADGIGEIHSISLYEALKGNIFLLKNYNLYSSLGVLYSQITHHLGFWVNSDEYKVMGLAPYGDAKRYKALFDEIIDYRDDGLIYIGKFKFNDTEFDRQTGRSFRHWLASKSFPERQPDEEITQEHKDLSAGLQYALERSLDHILSYWQKKTATKNLCLAGGVMLNCTANGVIYKKSSFDNIYVQSAANDAGTSIGAAIIQSQQKGIPIQLTHQELPYYGPGFNNNDFENALKEFEDRIQFQYLADDQLYREAAKWIADQKVIAWMQDRMEFGPRALGNRSILADPTNPNMRNHINKLVKKTRRL